MLFESIALSFVPNLGVRGAVHLVECFGSAEAVYAASEAELIERADLRRDIAASIVARKGFSEASLKPLRATMLAAISRRRSARSMSSASEAA